jgi:hypothetical protein
MNVFINNNPIRRIVTVWADVARPITRGTYVTHGVALAAAKYVGDVALVYTATGRLWTPADYVQTLPSLLLQSQWAGSTPWLETALVTWMLPFVAIGVVLTVRRALDAGHSPWWSILFLVPYANYAVMAALSALPSRPRDRIRSTRVSRITDATAFVLSAALGVVIALVAVAVGANALKSYGGWLFVLTPFAMGACTAFFYNWGRAVSARATISLVFATILTGAVALLFWRVEGLICLLMALPLALPLAVIGGLVGRLAATSNTSRRSSATLMLLALPVTAVVEPTAGHAVREVRSSVVIAAPPDAVWPHVVTFPQLPEPDDWVFRAGVAYPIRARIEGRGVGAVRYCEFSTGPFVEPITRWEPGRRLSFDVVDSPPTMEELSPYADLSPPHLQGYLRSKRGEFRLIDLGNGHTRLEGSTWYEIEMAPEAYWRVISDALIHRIHRRVLEHIKREVEGPSV